MRSYDRRARKPSVLAFLGCLLAAAAIALSAYAAHASADLAAQSRLQTAAWFAFGHGAVLAALGAASERLLSKAGLGLLLLGTLLFSGSLVGGAMAGWSTALAPIGGTALMLGWLLLAVHALRR